MIIPEYGFDNLGESIIAEMCLRAIGGTRHSDDFYKYVDTEWRGSYAIVKVNVASSKSKPKQVSVKIHIDKVETIYEMDR